MAKIQAVFIYGPLYECTLSQKHGTIPSNVWECRWDNVALHARILSHRFFPVITGNPIIQLCHISRYYLSIFPQIDFLPLNKTSMVREWFLETVTQIVQGFPEMTLNFPPKNGVGILSFPTRWTVMISCTVRTCRSRLELAVLQLVACRFTSIFATDANFVGIVPLICRNKDSYYWSN